MLWSDQLVISLEFIWLWSHQLVIGLEFNFTAVRNLFSKKVYPRANFNLIRRKKLRFASIRIQASSSSLQRIPQQLAVLDYHFYHAIPHYPGTIKHRIQITPQYSASSSRNYCHCTSLLRFPTFARCLQTFFLFFSCKVVSTKPVILLPCIAPYIVSLIYL